MTTSPPVDLQALKAKAQKATPGPWRRFPDVVELDQENHEARVCYSRDGETCEWCIALAGETLGEDDQVDRPWTKETLARWHADADYIAAVSPDQILTLIEIAEAADLVIADLDNGGTPSSQSTLLARLRSILDGSLKTP